LARRSGDLAGAEDALADAFATALERWPRDGVPERPEAWLITVARRRLADRARRSATPERFAAQLFAAAKSAEARAWHDKPFPDERLEMLFACAHPAIDAGTRTPLVLRTVLGVDAGRIASAFLVAPAAMRQRLVRARTKIRDAGIAFEVPESTQLGDRIAVVLDAIYAAFGLSWEESGTGGAGSDLNAEAVWLARAVAELLPREPEAHGLLALVLFVEARRPARRDTQGAYVALDQQDPRHWSAPMLRQAEAALAAAQSPDPGRFALEAVIQAAHVARRSGAPTDWRTIALLYDLLVSRCGAIGAAVSRAAAHARAYGDPAGLAALSTLDAARVARYQPYWALRAHLTGDPQDYDRAIGLAEDSATRSFLLARRAQCARQ